MSEEVNDHLVMVSGASSTGKSASLRDIPDPEGVMYLGTEAGKRLPFNSKFDIYKITDPLDVPKGIEAAEDMEHIHTIVVDSQTFLMDQFESIYVLGSTDTMKGWQNYQQFFKNLMQGVVAKSSKRIVFTAHTQSILNESEMVVETKIPVKGALKANGIEAYFSLVISTKKMTLKALEGYKSDLLTITEEEELLGFKHVFQTKLTKSTVNERIRAPMGMFTTQETFIDNNINLVFKRLEEYYD